MNFPPTVKSDIHLLVRRYLQALERFDHQELQELLDPNVIQHEFPNILQPGGVVRNRAAMLEGLRSGQKNLASQHFIIKNTIAHGDSIVVELSWTGILAESVGPLQAGDSLHANFAMFLDIRNGKIVNQRNYDCFDPIISTP
jgi:ketosteroid isomerase-like protein